MNKIHWQDFTSSEIETLSKEQAIIIIPTGATEQHGPHLPVGTDSIIISEIAEKIAEEVWTNGKKCIVAPVISMTNSMNHLSFPGTITLKPSTYIQVLTEYCESVYESGFKKILIFNGHGGNVYVNESALITITEKLGFPVYHIGFWSGAEEEMSSIVEGQAHGIMHACEGETSMMLAINEKLVRPNYKEINGKPIVQGTGENSASSFKRIEFITANGVLGNPSAATKEKGYRLLRIAIENLSKQLIDPDFWK